MAFCDALAGIEVSFLRDGTGRTDGTGWTDGRGSRNSYLDVRLLCFKDSQSTRISGSVGMD